MKSLLTILFSLSIFCCFGKVWRVNNTGLLADFTTAQDAHDNANVLPGDTLYIEPSTVSYGTLTINKRLTIISTGNFLDVNPNLQYRMDGGTLGAITVSASGTVLHCNASTIKIEDGIINCRVERCFCSGTTNALLIYGSNNLFTNNFFKGNVSFVGGSSNTFKNNIVLDPIKVDDLASASIINNVLGGTNSRNIFNSIFENNILTAGTYFFYNSTVRNNLSLSNTLPAGNGNLTNVNMASVFVNPSGTNDVSFVLLGGNNPAKAAGVNGEDCGAFGGSSPYLLGLQAAIPAIYQLNVPATASGSTMNISFSTKSNN